MGKTDCAVPRRPARNKSFAPWHRTSASEEHPPDLERAVSASTVENKDCANVRVRSEYSIAPVLEGSRRGRDQRPPTTTYGLDISPSHHERPVAVQYIIQCEISI